MRLAKAILASSLGLMLVGGTATVANASSKRGTPTILRGNWYTKYHKLKNGSGYYRYYIHAKKSVAWMYELDYNKHHKITNNTANFGIDRSLHYSKVHQHEYYLTGHSWNNNANYLYDFVFSNHNKKIKVWKGPASSETIYRWDTFYKK